jgi:hypothetical protein
MEVLRQDDLERARRTPPEEKAKQAFALMRPRSASACDRAARLAF